MPKQSFPDWIVPMAATLTQERFAGPEWSFERKFDGIRLLAYKKGKQIELFSRNRLPQNIPSIAKAIAQLPPRELILDGEIDWHAVTGTHASSRAAYHVFDILWLDGREVMSLPLEERRALLDQLPLKAPLQRVVELNAPELFVSSPSGRGPVRVRSLATGSQDADRSPTVNEDVSVPRAVATGSRGSSPTVREGVSVPGAVATGSPGSSPTVREGVSVPRAVATGSPGSSPTVREGVSVPRAVATGSSHDLAPQHDLPWEYARQESWEGVIAKRRGSVYEQRRSRNWLKMKCELAQEFVVGGFTDPQGKRVGLGALLVGYYERGSSPTVREGSVPDDFVFAGKIGTGFNTELLNNLRRQLDALEIAKPPFTRAVGLPRLRAHWVRPEIVVQVGFIQWTVHGKLRHPRLLHVRTDKDPRDVVRE